MDSPSRFSEGLVLGLAVLVSSALVVGGLFYWQTRGANVETAAQAEPNRTETTTTPPAPSVPATTTPPSTAPTPDNPDYQSVCPSDVPDTICELVNFVETVRGRAFKQFPTVELEEDSVFDQRLLSDFDEESDDLRRTGETLRSLGLIPTDADLVELFRASLEVGVVGFYRTDSEELVVRGADLGLYEQSVLVHELVHAFDDQWFGLDRPEYEERNDEIESGFLAVTEGNASRVEDLWADQLEDGDRTRLRLEEASTLSRSDLEVIQSIPRFVLQLQISPYVDGLTLVEAIDARGGETAVDAALENPPISTEQVLHPEDFFGGEAVRSVDAPRASGTIIDEGVWGELALRSWLGAEAAEGWGGDRYVTYDDADQVCTQMNIAMDTGGDRSELLAAAERWAGAGSSRSVDQQGDTVVLVGCVGK